MRTLAIGDIHGCLTALQVLDEELRFGREDVIITLGDYVDRGPDSRGVVEHLLALSERTTLVALRGNHEVMMLRSRLEAGIHEAWLDCGGRETLESYGSDSLATVPEEHWRFLEATLPVHETATEIYVHANLVPHLPADRQPDATLYWERVHSARPHLSGRRMICGHTPQYDGDPLNLGYAVCVDTYAYGNGWLTCLDTGSARGDYWQANQLGEFRRGRLMEPGV